MTTPTDKELIDRVTNWKKDSFLRDPLLLASRLEKCNEQLKEAGNFLWEAHALLKAKKILHEKENKPRDPWDGGCDGWLKLYESFLESQDKEND